MSNDIMKNFDACAGTKSVVSLAYLSIIILLWKEKVLNFLTRSMYEYSSIMKPRNFLEMAATIEQIVI